MIRFQPEAPTDGGRGGRLEWGTGAAETPLLVASAPWGAVAGLTPAELVALGVGGMVVGTLELAIRPGITAAVALGGVAPLADGLLTMAESSWRSVAGEWTGEPARVEHATDSGMVVRNALDGGRLDLTAEWSINAQEALGVQLGSALTVPPAMLRSKRFGGDPGDALLLQRQSLLARAGGLPLLAQRTSALSNGNLRQLASLPFAGITCTVAEITASDPWADLPPDWLRHVTGITGPDDLVLALSAGADLLETRAPLTLAKLNRAWTPAGVIEVGDQRWREATWPLDADCDCPACQFSLGYLRHLVVTEETLALTLLVQHNFRFLTQLIQRRQSSRQRTPRQPTAT